MTNHILPSMQPVTLRISVTNRCQLQCAYCSPNDCLPIFDDQHIISNHEIINFIRIVRDNMGIAKIRITGGDPLVRPAIDELIGLIAELGIEEIALTTNAQLLARMAPRLKAAGLRRVNISLDSLNATTFNELCRGKLHETMSGIDAAINCGLTPVKLNTVVLKGINDHEVPDILEYALEHQCEARFLELMPVSVNDDRHKEWFISSQEIRNIIERNANLSELPFVYGENCRRYKVNTNKYSGTVGFISPMSEPFCGGCSRLRLTSDGKLLGCLAGRKPIDIRQHLGKFNAANRNRVLSALASAMNSKNDRPDFIKQRHNMATIGG